MEIPPAKHARTNSAGDVHIPADQTRKETRLSPTQIEEYMEELRPEQLFAILTRAAQRHPDVAELVRERVERQREREQQRVLNFDGYSRDIWKTINVSYRGLSGGRQCEMAGSVVREIERVVDSVVRHCGAHVNPQTRWNGLSVLRKIGKTLAVSSGDVLAHEVQEEFQWRCFLEGGMLEILASMSAEEKAAIRSDESPEGLWPKLVELDGLRKGRCILNQMEDVLNELDQGNTDQEASESGSDDHDSLSAD